MIRGIIAAFGVKVELGRVDGLADGRPTVCGLEHLKAIDSVGQKQS